MQTWEYRVAYVDYQGRISSEGQETLIANERRTAFVRRYMDALGRNGWELVGIQPLSAQSAYYVFKRPGAADGTTSASGAGATMSGANPAGSAGSSAGAQSGAADQPLEPERV